MWAVPLTPACTQGWCCSWQWEMRTGFLCIWIPPPTAPRNLNSVSWGWRQEQGKKNSSEKKLKSTLLPVLSSSLKPVLQVQSVPIASSLGLGAALSIWGRSMMVRWVSSVLEIKEFSHKYKYVFFFPWRVCWGRQFYRSMSFSRTLF